MRHRQNISHSYRPERNAGYVDVLPRLDLNILGNESLKG